MIRLLREPLVQFLLIGGLAFAFHAWQQADTSEPVREKIVVSPDRIKQITATFAKTWQRQPTPDELKNLVDEAVLEEVYYRQAVAMGIDRDDSVIRRRLRQKLEFLTDGATAFSSDAELSAYLAENPDKFREPSTYTFRQVYFNPDRHADKSANWFDQQLAKLRSGTAGVGDPSLIADSHANATARVVDATFGSGFSARLDELEMGTWQGPIRSGLGLHMVLMNDRIEGGVPSLDKIRPIVQREWDNVQRLTNRKAVNAELLKDFDIVVEWPED